MYLERESFKYSEFQTEKIEVYCPICQIVIFLEKHTKSCCFSNASFHHEQNQTKPKPKVKKM